MKVLVTGVKKMKKIVRGKIKSIDAMVGKKGDSPEGEEVECIEYRITLENDTNEYITKSSLSFKEGSVVDICFNENKKNKDNTKTGIIVNKKVSNKLLEQFKAIKFMRWLCYPSLSFLVLFMMKMISLSANPIDIRTGILFSLIVLTFLYFIITTEKMYNGVKLSKEDEKVLKQYKKDFKIENEESLDKVKQVKVV